MKLSKRAAFLLGALTVILCLSLALALPSGAVTSEADSRYQDAMMENWDDFESDEEFDTSAARPYRVLASAALSDILPVNDIANLSTDIETIGNAPVEQSFTENGYRDDTMIVEIETIQQDDSVYHVAYIKIATPSQLRTTVAGGVKSDRTMPTTMLAESVNAVVAINGDFYTKSTGGYIVRQGQVLRKKVSDNYDLLFIDENGDFHMVKAGKKAQKAFITDLMERHELVNGFFFGPALVIDGEVQTISKEYGWNPTGQEPRAAIGQLAPLTYVAVTVDGRIDSSAGVTLQTLADFMGQIGCTQAYNLDGGNSSALVFHNELLSVKSVEERSVNDILYFASATDGE